MKTKALLCGLCCLFASIMAHATPTLTVGTPGDDLLSTPTKPSPILGGTFLNFDSLTPFASYSSYSASGITISSPDGLLVLPYSTQSGPNELFDNSPAGSANITVSLAFGVYGIGIGIADSDPVTISIQALGAGGVDLGSAFMETLASTESTINTGNGYYVIKDTTPDIYGLVITESASNANYSGLAIDDLQITPTPEPSSLALLATGLTALGSLARKKFQRA